MHIKNFKEISVHFKPGDYVVIYHPDNNIDEVILHFLRNNVGVIHSSEYSTYNRENFYNVKYDNIPKELQKHTRYIGPNDSVIFGLKEKGEIFTDYPENIRFATSKEIEIQNMKKTTNIYNL